MRYLLIIILMFNFVYSESFDVKNVRENILSPYMSYLKINNSENININDIIHFKEFQKVETTNLGLNFKDSIWTLVELKNSSINPIEIFLINNIPLTEKRELYVFENNRLILNKDVGVLSKEISYDRFNSSKLLIQPNNEYKILTKVYSPKTRVDIEWIMMTEKSFLNFIFADTIIWGLIFGIFLVLFILLVLFYFIFKNKSFISYLIYMFIFLVYLFVTNGYSTFFFGNGKIDLVLERTCAYSILLFYISFLDEYLGLTKDNKYKTLLKIIYIYSLYLFLTSLGIIIFPNIPTFDDFYFIFTLITLLILLFITAKESLKNGTISIFYIFGQLSLISGYLFLLLSNFKFIPIKGSNQEFLGVFASLEMLCFVIAIFSRIKKTVELKNKNEKLILSQSYFSSIGQTLKNIAHQWKVPTVRLGTLITELEAIIYNEQIKNERLEEIFENMRNSTEFMKNTITEFSTFYSNNEEILKFKVINEINDVKLLLIEKMKFLNFQILYDESIKEIEILGNPKTFAHVCIIFVDNAIEISKKRNIRNPWIRIYAKFIKEKLIIYFEDNCGGIMEKPINSIFELNVSSHKQKDRGLGLSIAKMLVEQKMHGKIEVLNYEKGAIFSLYL